MDWEREFEDIKRDLVETWDDVVAYFDSLGVYGLSGWGLLVTGLVLIVAGAVMLAL